MTSAAAGAVTASATAVAAIVLASTAVSVANAPGAMTVDDVLAGLVLGAGSLTAAWSALWAAIGAVTMLVAGLRRTTAPVERLIAQQKTPRLVRRALTAALGLTLAAGAAPALATTGSGDPADLGWDAAVVRAADLPAPSPAAPPSLDQASHQAPPQDAAPPPRTSAPSPHVVAPGESLWSIAADHLDESASLAEVSAAWPRWYEANRAAVGDDPDLITPGLVLTPPTDTQTTGG